MLSCYLIATPFRSRYCASQFPPVFSITATPFDFSCPDIIVTGAPTQPSSSGGKSKKQPSSSGGKSMNKKSKGTKSKKRSRRSTLDAPDKASTSASLVSMTFVGMLVAATGLVAVHRRVSGTAPVLAEQSSLTRMCDDISPQTSSTRRGERTTVVHEDGPA